MLVDLSRLFGTQKCMFWSYFSGGTVDYNFLIFTIIAWHTQRRETISPTSRKLCLQLGESRYCKVRWFAAVSESGQLVWGAFAKQSLSESKKGTLHLSIPSRWGELSGYSAEESFSFHLPTTQLVPLFRSLCGAFSQQRKVTEFM